jgi:vitamin K-dependent gamma-carboxylase
MRPNVLDSVRAAATRPVDIASLAAFRVIFGTVMFASCVRLLTSGWIDTMYVEPKWFFKYAGFGWVQPWPAWGMYLHYVVLAVLALAIATGAFYRVVMPLFTIGFAYTQLIDVTNYLNHHYLAVLLGGLLSCLPAHAAWSIDARRNPELRRATIPAWMVWLLRFQIGVVYTFAGLAKLKVDWLLHGQPLNLWLSARTETPLVGRLFAEQWFGYVMSWAGFLFDTTIAFWLSWRRTRGVAYAVVILFHGATGYLFNIGMFPIIMTTSALIFFSPSWPRALLARIGVRTTIPDVAHEPHVAPSRAARVVIAVYVLAQLGLPLRHHVYPGSVLWNEDGMRFAWHVLIREKHGNVMFVAAFDDGRRLEIPPRNYLTPRQEREMAGQPDMILQLARHIADDLHARGFQRFAIHAETSVSLNGRKPLPLIDPAVDLLEVTDFGARGWVLPEPSETPRGVRGTR